MLAWNIISWGKACARMNKSMGYPVMRRYSREIYADAIDRSRWLVEDVKLSVFLDALHELVEVDYGVYLYRTNGDLFFFDTKEEAVAYWMGSIAQ